MKKQILKFYETRTVYRCPVCGSEIHMPDNAPSLICGNGHCFDISSKGYVNFIQKPQTSKVYDSVFFENRRDFFRDGFYNHISDEINRISAEKKNNALSPVRIADAGCGEGSFALSLDTFLHSDCEIFAFDFSRDAAQIASRGGNNILWMVSDIANIPLKNDSMDIVFNIYSPANYAEFKRILKKDGILVKAVPGANHMCELRRSLKNKSADENGTKSGEYSSQQVVDIFSRNFELAEKYTVSRTLGVNENQLQHMLNMTPVMFGEEIPVDAFHEIRNITIEAEILIGIRNNTEIKSG